MAMNIKSVLLMYPNIENNRDIKVDVQAINNNSNDAVSMVYVNDFKVLNKVICKLGGKFQRGERDMLTEHFTDEGPSGPQELRSKIADLKGNGSEQSISHAIVYGISWFYINICENPKYTNDLKESVEYLKIIKNTILHNFEVFKFLAADDILPDDIENVYISLNRFKFDDDIVKNIDSYIFWENNGLKAKNPVGVKIMINNLPDTAFKDFKNNITIENQNAKSDYFVVPGDGTAAPAAPATAATTAAAAATATATAAPAATAATATPDAVAATAATAATAAATIAAKTQRAQINANAKIQNAQLKASAKNQKANIKIQKAQLKASAKNLKAQLKDKKSTREAIEKEQNAQREATNKLHAIQQEELEKQRQERMGARTALANKQGNEAVTTTGNDETLQDVLKSVSSLDEATIMDAKIIDTGQDKAAADKAVADKAAADKEKAAEKEAVDKKDKADKAAQANKAAQATAQATA